MMKNKIKYILTFVLVFVVAVNNIFAVDIYDTKLTENVYKVSEDDSSFSVPFFRLSEQRIELDKSVDQIGMFMTNSTIDVNAEQKGIQMLYTNDTVRVNSSMEYAIILSSGSVVLNSDIEKTVLVYCNGTLTISESATIKGNIIAYTPNMVIDGVVDGNILGSVNTVTVNNAVNGKIKMDVFDFKLGENAKITQLVELNTSNTALKIDENVVASKIDVKEVKKASFSDSLTKILKNVLSAIVMYLILLIFVKKDKLQTIIDKLENKRVMKNGVWGYFVLLMILSAGIIVLMLLAELGVAAMIFSIAVLVIITLLKNVIVGTFIIDLVNKKYKEKEVKPSNIIVTIVTFLMLVLLESIPFVGEIISFIVFILALGIIISLVKPNTEKVEVAKQEVIDAK